MQNNNENKTMLWIPAKYVSSIHNLQRLRCLSKITNAEVLVHTYSNLFK